VNKQSALSKKPGKAIRFNALIIWRKLSFAAWLVVVSLFTSGFCFGEPFLVSDPYRKTEDQPTRFTILVGKLEFSVPAEKLPDGTVRLKFDLGNLPEGEQAIEIKAVNESTRAESPPVSVQVLKKDGKVVMVPTAEKKPEKEKIPPSRTIPGLIRP
jgi:hypothetical protein